MNRRDEWPEIEKAEKLSERNVVRCRFVGLDEDVEKILNAKDGDIVYVYADGPRLIVEKPIKVKPTVGPLTLVGVPDE